MDDLDVNNPEDDMPEDVAWLLELRDRLDDGMRKIGLYMEDHMVIQGISPEGYPQAAIAVQFAIGDIAFAVRTQDPEADTIDRQFREMTTNMQNDEFLEVREKMKQNIADGKDPFDGLDDV